MTKKAIVIAGVNSGCGKTTITLGLMAAFKKIGLSVQGFKVGPDYIDPSLHKEITGFPSVNLDSWMMPEKFIKYSFSYRTKNADISVVEGVMGLYDGKSAISDQGSTSDLAVKLKLPVVLVVNAKSMARTAAAIVKGLIDFNPELNIIGVIFNRIGSENHLKILRDSINKYCGIPVLGGLKNIEFQIPSRHLGLYMGDEGILLPDEIDYLANQVIKNIDINYLLDLSIISIEKHPNPINNKTKKIPKKRIAIARDRAFCFYYQDNIDILKSLGYEIINFSPINDQKLPENIDAIYFGGGYPELYAQKLSNNKKIKEEIYDKSTNGTIIYAECGGLMYLGKYMTTIDGIKYPMIGAIEYETCMQKKLQNLGYVEIMPDQDFFIFNKKIKIRGHVFHYSKIKITIDIPNFYSGEPESKAIGFKQGNILVSYVHLHFSNLLY